MEWKDFSKVLKFEIILFFVITILTLFLHKSAIDTKAEIVINLDFIVAVLYGFTTGKTIFNLNKLKSGDKK